MMFVYVWSTRQATEGVVVCRCVDYVRLYLDLESPAVNERFLWNYELCNDDLTTKGTDTYYSSAPWLLMALHTDKYASNHTGFRAVYRFLDKRKNMVLSHYPNLIPLTFPNFTTGTSDNGPLLGTLNLIVSHKMCSVAVIETEILYIAI